MNAILEQQRNKAGLPANMIWGFVAMLVFMAGDGLEHAWLSPYLIERGLTVQQAATLFTAYGAVLAVSAYFSGVLTEIWGPRKVMLIGLITWLVGQVLFIELGLKQDNYAAMLPTYALRGIGYPFFCYSFLVWVTYRSPQRIMATAVGLFWAAWSGGLYVDRSMWIRPTFRPGNCFSTGSKRLSNGNRKLWSRYVLLHRSGHCWSVHQ